MIYYKVAYNDEAEQDYEFIGEFPDTAMVRDAISKDMKRNPRRLFGEYLITTESPDYLDFRPAPDFFFKHHLEPVKKGKPTAIGSPSHS